MKKVKVSIIVPVYNVEPYLRCSMDSLIGQTLLDIEIICVDDKSTDSSLKILNEYSEKDQRVKVIALEKNSGGSTARNRGMMAAVGEYIGFLDSDDYVDLDFYEKLYTRATATNADIIKGSAQMQHNGKVERFGRSNSKIMANRAWFDCAFYSAIYRRDFLEKNRLEFPPGIVIGEDVVFLYKAVILAGKIELTTDDSHYFYIRREDSLDSKSFNEAKIETSLISFNMIIDFINDVDLDEESYSVVFETTFKRLLNGVFYRSNRIKIKVFIIQEAVKLFKKCKYPVNYKKNNKILYKFLESEDEAGLLLFLINDKRRVVFRLFGIIPILEIRSKIDKKIWRLFNFIPLWLREESECKIVYKLFCIIPIFTRFIK